MANLNLSDEQQRRYEPLKADLNADIKTGLNTDAQTNPTFENNRLAGQQQSLQPLYFLSVNYYSAALLSDLMHTLETNQGIVIVNNSPTDRVVHGLAGRTYGGGQVTVIDAPQNDGFGAGCNIGLQWIYARSPQALVWLINPDTQLLPSAISTVRSCFIQREIAILGTPVLDATGRLWSGAGRFNRWTGSISARHLATDKLGRPQLVRWVSGCSMILNLATLEHCPQFDEVYFLYYEDSDLCERYYQQDYRIAIAPEPLVVHAVSSITARHTHAKYMHATFSKLTFLRRHATPLALALNLIYLLAQSLLLKLSNKKAAKGRWDGLKHFLNSPRTRPATIPDSATGYPLGMKDQINSQMNSQIRNSSAVDRDDR